MKYKQLYIIFSLFAFFIFSSDSCDSNAEERQKWQKNQFHKKIATIKDGFESDYLTETTRIAYEVKAKQKLIDFSDYFTIYSDKSLDSLFREKTGEMMMHLFHQNKTKLEFMLNDSERRNRMNTKELLQKLQRSEFDVLQLKIDSIQTYKTLERINESAYMGELCFYQSVEGIRGNDTTLIDLTTMQCEFYVMKVMKNFGTESKKIWKVFLGDIKKF